MKKEELHKRVSELEKQAAEALEKVRLQWLNSLCKEGRDHYKFSSLGELVQFLVDHAAEIQPKSGDE